MKNKTMYRFLIFWHILCNVFLLISLTYEFLLNILYENGNNIKIILIFYILWSLVFFISQLLISSFKRNVNDMEEDYRGIFSK